MADEPAVEVTMRRILTRLRQSQTRVGCPDEESLANFLSGYLSAAATDEIETHLASCSLCLDDIVAVHEAGIEAETEKVPQRFLDRAMALVKPKRREENVLNLVVRLVKDAVELVSTSGEWVAPLATQPVGVRGKPAVTPAGILLVEKQLGKYKVAVEVEQIENSMCQVIVKVTHEDGKPADGVRFSLVSGDREQASYMTRQGVAVFDEIPKGDYSLEISDVDGSVGSIRLAIEEGQHG